MLTSTLLASISHRTATTTTHTKDASIFQLAFQPPSALPRAVLKKSSTPRNALAYTPTHIFAAQADRAAIHVYARESGVQQLLLPLKEKCTALTAANDGVVVMGMEGGGIMLWDTLSGRVVRTPEAHLGAVTAVRVEPAGTFALSAGEDGAVLVWCLPAMLAMGDVGADWVEWRRVPVRALRAHRGAVVDLQLGHAKGARNIAVSAGEDDMLVVWDYQEGTQLRTILLPATPTCLTLDPCDRAVLCGFKDGSAACVDFMAMDEQKGIKNPVWDEKKQSLVVQVEAQAKWRPPTKDVGAVLCAEMSYDGTKLLTGHETGNIVVWDVPTSRYNKHLTATPLPGPVSCLILLEIGGLGDKKLPTLMAKEVVKPRFGELDTGDDEAVPDNYKVTARLVGELPVYTASATTAPATGMTAVELALCHPSFPSDLLAESIADLQSFRNGGGAPQPTQQSAQQSAQQTDAVSNEADFMALDGPADKNTSLQQENEALKKQVEALQRLQKESFAQLEKMSEQNRILAKKAQLQSEGRLAADQAKLQDAEQSWEANGGRRKQR